MKTYEAIFEPKKNKGVYGISLVEKPAMEGHFIALSEAPVQLSVVNEDERILIGLVLEPNKAIYRNQGGEEFNIFFSDETVKELAYGFYKGGFHNNSSVEHKGKIEGVTFVESWIIEDSKNDKSSALGLSYPKGSWMATMKVDSTEVWDDYVKTGKVKGFSIDALVSLKEINLKNHNNMSDHKSIIDAIREGFRGLTKIDLGKTKTATGNAEINFEGDTMEIGGKVWLIADDGTEVPLPMGEYELEDKRILVVKEEGKIDEVKDAPKEEKPEDKPTEMSSQDKDTISALIREGVNTALKDHTAAKDKVIIDLKAEVAELKKKTLEFGKQPASKPVKGSPEPIKLNTARARFFNDLQNS